jgi:hypothetical protein
MRSMDLMTYRGPAGSRTGRRAVAWVLIVGFLLQPVLAYLVTPILVHDGNDRQVVICTLEGIKRVKLELPQLADNGETEHCSALKLYQMASTAQVSEAPVSPAAYLYSVDLLQQTVGHQSRSLHFSAYSTRAPPQIS